MSGYSGLYITVRLTCTEEKWLKVYTLSAMINWTAMKRELSRKRIRVNNLVCILAQHMAQYVKTVYRRFKCTFSVTVTADKFTMSDAMEVIEGYERTTHSDGKRESAYAQSIRPPGTMSFGRASVLPQMFFFVSLVVLRAPSTDRPETLPHDQNLAEFYNPTPKVRGVLPKKNLGAKNMQNFGQFWTTSDFDREYLRNSTTHLKSERRTN